MKERKYYEQKYKMIDEKEMYSEKDRTFMLTTTDSNIKSPHFEVLLKREEKAPLLLSDERLIEKYQKLVQRFSRHHYDPLSGRFQNQKKKKFLIKKKIQFKKKKSKFFSKKKKKNLYKKKYNQTIKFSIFIL